MLGQACALAAALIWSISVILFKRSEAVSPQAMNLFKNVAALTLLLLTLLLLGQTIDWQRPAEEWWVLLLSGALGIAVADTLVFMALR
ncbi:MAG: EamA family transporter, partial [Deltaproteobacteria bacterium]